jgi:hypothetical protein
MGRFAGHQSTHSASSHRRDSLRPDHLDTIAREMFASPNRRRFVSHMTAGLLATFGLAYRFADTTAKKKRPKKRPRCRGCAVCMSCVGGRCQSVPDRTPCGGACQECIGGACVNKPDDTPCGGTSLCLAGVCNVRPGCVSAGVGVDCGSFPPPDCCSDQCDFREPPATDVCEQGGSGTRCRVDSDCTSGSCVGYVCQ